MESHHLIKYTQVGPDSEGNPCQTSAKALKNAGNEALYTSKQRVSANFTLQKKPEKTARFRGFWPPRTGLRLKHRDFRAFNVGSLDSLPPRPPPKFEREGIRINPYLVDSKTDNHQASKTVNHLASLLLLRGQLPAQGAKEQSL